MPNIAPQPPTPKAAYPIAQQGREPFMSTPFFIAIQEADAWLASIVDCDGPAEFRADVHDKAMTHTLTLMAYFQSGHARNVLPRHPEAEHAYQMLLLLLMKTAIQNGDGSWTSFEQSAHCAYMMQTFSGLAWLDARQRDMTAAGLSTADRTTTWLDCCYNFARTLTYAPAPAPNGTLPDDSNLQKLIDDAAELHGALKAIGYSEDLSCSVANNEFSYQLLQRLRSQDASYLPDDDPLISDVMRLHATYVDAIGNPRLGDDLALMANTEVYLPRLLRPAQEI